jgi:hypothetical protein
LFERIEVYLRPAHLSFRISSPLHGHDANQISMLG